MLASRFCREDCPNKTNERFTKPVALILLAHYVADIHQPLHVRRGIFRYSRAESPIPTKTSQRLEMKVEIRLRLN